METAELETCMKERDIWKSIVADVADNAVRLKTRQDDKLLGCFFFYRDKIRPREV